MIRVLFIDDEPRVLSGIDNALLFSDVDWRAEFAESGEEAVARISNTAYDVIVTDMKMPGLTGADVLEHAIKAQPHAVRIILSGEVDPELAERAMPLSHEFVSKPCDPEDLFTIIQRVHMASQKLEQGRVRDVLVAMDRLPVQPVMHDRIRQTLSDGGGANDVAAIVEADLAIASAVLRTANSAFYGFRTSAASIREAVVRLGSQTVSGIVLNAEVAAAAPPSAGPLIEKLNAHAVMTSRMVSDLVGTEVPQAAMAGLLHDIGILVLITQFPDEWERLQEVGPDVGDPDEAAELDAYGVTHAEVGAYMLELWKVDPVVVEATRDHHARDLTVLAGPAALVVAAIAATDAAEHPDRQLPIGLDPGLVTRAANQLAGARPSAGEGR